MNEPKTQLCLLPWPSPMGKDTAPPAAALETLRAGGWRCDGAPIMVRYEVKEREVLVHYAQTMVRTIP